MPKRRRSQETAAAAGAPAPDALDFILNPDMEQVEYEYSDSEDDDF